LEKKIGAVEPCLSYILVMSASAKLCLDTSNTIYFIVSIVT
jgi:hypothetical protein